MPKENRVIFRTDDEMLHKVGKLTSCLHLNRSELMRYLIEREYGFWFEDSPKNAEMYKRSWAYLGEVGRLFIRENMKRFKRWHNRKTRKGEL